MRSVNVERQTLLRENSQLGAEELYTAEVQGVESQERATTGWQGDEQGANLHVGKVAKETRKDEPQLREQRDTYPLSANRIIEPGSDLSALPGSEQGSKHPVFWTSLADVDTSNRLIGDPSAIIVSKMDTKSSVLD
ncbi:hypothetical protein DBV15_03614 [Temnothorax longispinosus]|uniref:Uncharacterized protein n=1 Tax=Temnothorax longispinosus TaxID=300112 RepID=A0A4V3SAS2_9HYME|nr:hypothetical protein DBV15_03614 [Temnothorax longispinosus]